MKIHIPDSGRDFSPLQQRFNQNIYGTPKGRLRLDLLKEDFDQVVTPGMQDSDKVLDVGCGEARMSAPFIEAGLRVTLLDLSEDMLSTARARFVRRNVDISQVSWLQGPLQEHLPALSDTYQLVIVHAVLEWLKDPWSAMQLILERVCPGGLLSLAFYNRNSLIYRNLLQGNFRKINKNDWQQSSSGLTPNNPIDPDQLTDFLEERGLAMVSKRGIRSFYDFMRERVKNDRSYEDVLEMERRYSQKEPFMSLGRYIHMVWRKPE